ncbi:SpoIIE family protein phosphatase [Streptomyces sp. TBY4]|uniref:SpoIIE family protein phosphatase n=1 Tax=Streptomyces sp. TBY4 TaxID=2962030 RepID=UPI0020B76DBB|nr:SpoIIE family protein phosphatase [Streptomyces sp. TBY4]MCP3754602.1 SpoIIE family protein phosphatase [Streptomyces sp. TBY4]
MNRFARLATRVLAVPLGLVCLEPAGEAAGALPECWPPATRPDQAVLECCRRVAEDGRPLFLSRAGDGTAAFSFAGVPLVGSSGELLGVLAVMDPGLRLWTEDEVQDLSDLAAAYSAQARMRARTEIGRQAREAAEEESSRVHELLNRSELLLRASEDLADTRGLDDVRQRVGDLVSGDLKPARVDLILVRQGTLHRVPSPVDGDAPLGGVPGQFALASHWPVSRAVRENRMVVVVDAHADPDAPGGTVAGPGFDALNLHTAACLPLRGTHSVLGALVLGWDTPHEIGLDERAVLTTLAGYTAQAVERALHLDDRVTAASQLQRAMLTDLPDTPGLELAALYRPAARDDMVGGDWYDAYPLPRAPAGVAGALALTVGDITGHDMRAAALMGQVRSMLRQADHDHPGQGPEQALSALERACRRLNLPASGTAVHAHIHPAADGHWHLKWSNAGHPAPLLLTPDGRVENLTAHDVLLHHALPPGPRTCGTRSLPPGSTLLLYTDGLVEERGTDIDENVERLVRELATAPPGIRLHALLRSLLDTIGPQEAQDDTVLFAVRVPAP